MTASRRRQLAALGTSAARLWGLLEALWSSCASVR
jgi:hypothetical protein